MIERLGRWFETKMTERASARQNGAAAIGLAMVALGFVVAVMWNATWYEFIGTYMAAVGSGVIIGAMLGGEPVQKKTE
ncbi:MAG: hypothetical protein AAFQ73_16860 [Pseudomonadota bacterium]